MKALALVGLLFPIFAWASADICGYPGDTSGSWVEGEKTLLFVRASGNFGPLKAVLLDKKCHATHLKIDEKDTIDCDALSVGDGAERMYCTVGHKPSQSTTILTYKHGKITVIESDADVK
jgi:hypothetical protein